jgi:uncharacterized protein (TIGR03067 family)
MVKSSQTHMRLLVLAAAVLGLTAGCSNTHHEAVERELERLQGTWVGVSFTDAQKTVDGRDMGMSLVIAGDQFTVRYGDSVQARGKLGLDPTRTPRTIDFEEEQQTRPGIYELYGDDLRVCYDATGQERPAKLAVKPGTGLLLFVLRRQKGDPG